VLSQMDNRLLNLATLTIRTHSLVIGAVLLAIPLDVDCSYVDGGSFVVFIIDTTASLAPFDKVWTLFLV
jgi:hypothetical protein